ncbi:CubicO group peptidase, beta-lactamase class C family [Algoriphagus locisalis]|uniref:CubicO group peptidase, beta-lactamase class C family n=1 Tax=Algoriphagus locisalis TaxID=305507 RepID=A0A1I7BD47_9BACT|nr:serine hydrolase [Algoriphagus locisalis]SFT85087.1 CubicO group peptidase, beta-lactamase class C family [Algoriphagus locisalis]
MRIILFSLIFLVGSTLTFAQTKLDTKKLDDKLKALQEATMTVGFSVAVVQGNEVIYSKGFGYRDLEKKIEADENTLYAIGSSSKAFTVALLGIMEEEKGLKFSDSPKKYLPELEFYNDELTNQVTITDMISHRTGLPRHDISWYLFPSEDKDSLLMRIKHQEPFTGVRKQWYYNNFMYLAQGLITEKLTGKSWEENIKERFFKPLNMTTSNVSIKELEGFSNISKGYTLEEFTNNKVTPYYNIAAISPAGSINSSVKEMANWVKIWLNGGKFGEVQVLPESYVARAVNPLMLVGGGIADKKFPDQHLNSYGYAWFTSSYKGHYRLEHGGNIDGFSANVAFFPTDSLGIVVLTNQNGSALPNLVRDAISDELLDLEKTDWVGFYTDRIEKIKEQQKEAKEKQESSTVPNTQPSHALVEYTGKYNHPGYGTFQIEFKNDSLWAQFPRERLYLKHRHYDVFEPYLVKENEVDTLAGLGVNFNFRSDEFGDIESANVKFEPTLEPLTFKRTPAEAKVSLEMLETYVGTYSLSGTDLKISLKDEALTLFVPGQPEYSLTPTQENEFIVKGLPGYKVRFEEKEGVLNMLLIQPNGTFAAVKK